MPIPLPAVVADAMCDHRRHGMARKTPLTMRASRSPFNLSGFGAFPAPSPIPWAAPEVTAALFARHAEFACDLVRFPPVAVLLSHALTTDAEYGGAGIGSRGVTFRGSMDL